MNGRSRAKPRDRHAMIRHAMSMHGTNARVLAATAALVLVLAAPRAFADVPATLTAIVWVSSTTDRALLSRVQGQTADLDVTLSVADDTLPDDLAAQLSAATRLARERGARVAVWFTLDRLADPSNLLVHVADVSSGRVFVRAIAAAHGDGANTGADVPAVPSATLEAAALVVRGALRALAQGGTIGIAAPNSTSPSSVLSRGPSAPSWRVSASVGWQTSIDGLAAFGHHGPAARISGGTGLLEVGASFGSALPVTRVDAWTSVQLTRLGFDVWVGAAWTVERQFRFGAHVGVGAVLYFRATAAIDPRATPTPPRVLPSILVSPEVSAAWFPTALRGRLGVSLTLGADVVPSAPALGYDDGSGFQRFQTLWPVQPRIGLALSLATE